VNPLEGHLYRPLVWSAAVMLLAMAVLLSIQMISAVVGPFRLAEVGERDPRAVVALLRQSHQAPGAVVLGPFAHDLVEAGRAVRELASLEALDPERFGTVVLTEPRVLREDDTAALRRFLAAGRGVVLVGSVGVLDPDGSWRGYDTMKGLLGADVVPFDTGHGGPIVASRRGPIASPLPPRSRIGVLPQPGLPALATTDAELRWEAAGTAASLRRRFGDGRLAWLAVDPDSTVATDTDRRSMRRVLEAATAWAGQMPWVEVLPWPDGARFAGLVEQVDDPGPRADWRDAMDAAEADGGLARLRPARGAAMPSPALASATREAERRGGWMATRSELATWTRQRSSIEASVLRTGPRRVVVSVTNHGAGEVARVVLRVYLNTPALRATAEATELLQASAHVRLEAGSEWLDFVLPPLGARSSTAYSLDYEPAPGRAG